MKRCPNCGALLRPFTPDLFGGNEMVGRDHPITSRQAAAHVLRSRSQTQQQVMSMFVAKGPLTDLELHAHCCTRYGERAESSYRKRRTELTDLGVVIDTGQTKVEDGERRVLWDLSPTCRQVISDV